MGVPVLANHHAPFSAIILAGGSSQRMGSDKALLEIDGIPLVLRVARALSASGAAQIIVAGGSEALRTLLATIELDIPVTVVADQAPGQGPLGGTISGFAAVDDVDDVVVVACDLPNLEPHPLHELVSARRATDADLAVPLLRGERQWHCVVWNRRCLPTLVGAFTDGGRSLRRAARSLSQSVLVSAESAWLTDLDTPDDVSAFCP